MHTNASIAKDISRHVSNQHASSDTIPATASLSVLTALQQLFDPRMQCFTVVNRCELDGNDGKQSQRFKVQVLNREQCFIILYHTSLHWDQELLENLLYQHDAPKQDLAGQSLASGVGPQQWHPMSSDGINIINLQIIMQTMIKKNKKSSNIQYPIVTDPMPLRPRMLLSCLHPLIHEQLKPWSRSGRLAMNL